MDARFEGAGTPGHFTCMRAGHFPVPENPRGITTPALLIEGANDTLLESGWSQLLAQLPPSSVAKTIEAKHCPNITRPEQTWEIINEFLSAQVAGGRA